MLVVWSVAMESRLKELAAEGFMGQEIAAKLSAEFGVYFSPDAIFHKCGRLGLSVCGRSVKSNVTFDDPFGVPSWLKKELVKAEEDARERPRKVVVLTWLENCDVEITEELIQKRETEAYRELWGEYVSNIFRSGRCTAKQAKGALKTGPPEWFKMWSEVFIVQMWSS